MQPFAITLFGLFWVFGCSLFPPLEQPLKNKPILELNKASTHQGHKGNFSYLFRAGPPSLLWDAVKQKNHVISTYRYAGILFTPPYNIFSCSAFDDFIYTVLSSAGMWVIMLWKRVQTCNYLLSFYFLRQSMGLLFPFYWNPNTLFDVSFLLNSFGNKSCGYCT